jgi:hypothetical protein
MRKKSIKDRAYFRIVGKYEQYDETGKLKQEGVIENLVTTSGDQWITDLLADTPTKVLFTNAFMILGTGWAGAAKGDVWVTTGYAGNGKAMDATYPTALLAVLTFRTTFSPGEGTANGINEAAIASANSDGGGGAPALSYILAHGNITPTVNLAIGDTLICSWTVTFLGS